MPTLLESSPVTLDQARAVSPLPEALVRYVLVLDAAAPTPLALEGEVLIVMRP